MVFLNSITYVLDDINKLFYYFVGLNSLSLCLIMWYCVESPYFFLGKNDFQRFFQSLFYIALYNKQYDILSIQDLINQSCSVNNIERMIKYEEYDKCVISPDKKQKKTMCVDGIFYIEKKQNHVISVTDEYDDFSFRNTLIIDDLLDDKKNLKSSRRTFTIDLHDDKKTQKSPRRTFIVERNEDTDGNFCKRLLTKYKKIFCVKKNFLTMVGFIFQWSSG